LEGIAEEVFLMKKIILVCVFLLFQPAVGVAEFVDNGDGTVTDVSNGLIWQQPGAENTMTWEAAISYCEGLTLAGYADWRLPNRKELRLIVDYNEYNPAIDTAYFPNTVSSYYWSSSTYAYTTGVCLEHQFLLRL
jgi:hypothetical protein